MADKSSEAEQREMRRKGNTNLATGKEEQRNNGSKRGSRKTVRKDRDQEEENSDTEHENAVEEEGVERGDKDDTDGWVEEEEEEGNP